MKNDKFQEFIAKREKQLAENQKKFTKEMCDALSGNNRTDRQRRKKRKESR